MSKRYEVAEQPVTRKKRLAAIQRRIDHLAKRVAEAGENKNRLSYDRAELDALLWAVEELEHGL